MLPVYPHGMYVQTVPVAYPQVNSYSPSPPPSQQSPTAHVQRMSFQEMSNYTMHPSHTPSQAPLPPPLVPHTPPPPLPPQHMHFSTAYTAPSTCSRSVTSSAVPASMPMYVPQNQYAPVPRPILGPRYHPPGYPVNPLVQPSTSTSVKMSVTQPLNFGSSVNQHMSAQTIIPGTTASKTPPRSRAVPSTSSVSPRPTLPFQAAAPGSYPRNGISKDDPADEAVDELTSKRTKRKNSLPFNPKWDILHRKFAEVIQEHGPLEAMDEKIIGVFIQLSAEDRKLIMTQGSIQSFLTKAEYINVEGNKLIVSAMPEISEDSNVYRFSDYAPDYLGGYSEASTGYFQNYNGGYGNLNSEEKEDQEEEAENCSFEMIASSHGILIEKPDGKEKREIDGEGLSRLIPELSTYSATDDELYMSDDEDEEHGVDGAHRDRQIKLSDIFVDEPRSVTTVKNDDPKQQMTGEIPPDFKPAVEEHVVTEGFDLPRNDDVSEALDPEERCTEPDDSSNDVSDNVISISDLSRVNVDRTFSGSASGAGHEDIPAITAMVENSVLSASSTEFRPRSSETVNISMSTVPPVYTRSLSSELRAEVDEFTPRFMLPKSVLESSVNSDSSFVKNAFCSATDVRVQTVSASKADTATNTKKIKRQTVGLQTSVTSVAEVAVNTIDSDVPVDSGVILYSNTKSTVKKQDACLQTNDREKTDRATCTVREDFPESMSSFDEESVRLKEMEDRALRAEDHLLQLQAHMCIAELRLAEKNMQHAFSTRNCLIGFEQQEQCHTYHKDFSRQIHEEICRLQTLVESNRQALRARIPLSDLPVVCASFPEIHLPQFSPGLICDTSSELKSMPQPYQSAKEQSVGRSGNSVQVHRESTVSKNLSAAASPLQDSSIVKLGDVVSQGSNTAKRRKRQTSECSVSSSDSSRKPPGLNNLQDCSNILDKAIVSIDSVKKQNKASQKKRTTSGSLEEAAAVRPNTEPTNMLNVKEQEVVSEESVLSSFPSVHADRKSVSGDDVLGSLSVPSGSSVASSQSSGQPHTSSSEIGSLLQNSALSQGDGLHRMSSEAEYEGQRLRKLTGDSGDGSLQQSRLPDHIQIDKQVALPPGVLGEAAAAESTTAPSADLNQADTVTLHASGDEGQQTPSVGEGVLQLPESLPSVSQAQQSTAIMPAGGASQIPQFDPVLHQAVMVQLAQLYPHLVSTPQMLNVIAMQHMIAIQKQQAAAQQLGAAAVGANMQQAVQQMIAPTNTGMQLAALQQSAGSVVSSNLQQAPQLPPSGLTQNTGNSDFMSSSSVSLSGTSGTSSSSINQSSTRDSDARDQWRLDERLSMSSPGSSSNASKNTQDSNRASEPVRSTGVPDTKCRQLSGKSDGRQPAEGVIVTRQQNSQPSALREWALYSSSLPAAGRADTRENSRTVSPATPDSITSDELGPCLDRKSAYLQGGSLQSKYKPASHLKPGPVTVENLPVSETSENWDGEADDYAPGWVQTQFRVQSVGNRPEQPQRTASVGQGKVRLPKLPTKQSAVEAQEDSSVVVFGGAGSGPSNDFTFSKPLPSNTSEHEEYSHKRPPSRNSDHSSDNIYSFTSSSVPPRFARKNQKTSHYATNSTNSMDNQEARSVSPLDILSLPKPVQGRVDTDHLVRPVPKPLPIVASSIPSVLVNKENAVARKEEGGLKAVAAMVLNAEASQKSTDLSDCSAVSTVTEKELSSKNKEADALNPAMHSKSAVKYAYDGRVSEISDIKLMPEKPTYQEKKESFTSDFNTVAPVQSEADDWQEVGKKRKRELSRPDSGKSGSSSHSQSSAAATSNFEKLVAKLMENFPHLQRGNVLAVISEVRNRHGGLKGLAMSQIVAEAYEIMWEWRDQLPETPDGTSTEYMKKLRYKTQICQSWTQTGTCKNGVNCLYAHGKDDLRALPKLSLCTNFMKGSCIFEDKCVFAHGEHELRRPATSSASTEKPRTLVTNSQFSVALQQAKAKSFAAMLKGPVLQTENKFQDLDDDEDPDGEMCVICHDNISPRNEKVLDCGHKFHEQCINQWVYGRERTCPTCRSLALFPDEFPKLGK